MEMTENEAIKELKMQIETAERMVSYNAAFEPKHDNSVLASKIKTAEMAIKALEEIQQYRAIGTVEECREAREKQRAKIPGYEGDGYSDGEMVYDTWICPNCSESYEVGFDEYEYCPNCGQHIDRLRGEEE